MIADTVKKNIPNFITCLNVASGVMAIICASRNTQEMWGYIPAYQWAYIFIGIAAVADFLDGFSARLLHAYSNLGKELDSLCDLVSFGVAPAIILSNCLDYMSPQPWIHWFAVLIPVAGALRLAKFNIDTRQTTSFIGLPIPANAIFWIGFTGLAYDSVEWLADWYVALPAIVLMSWLMISSLHLFSLKFKTWGWKGNQWRWLLVITAVVLVFCMGIAGFMWLIIAYVLYGIFAGWNS